jgi:hypothetical protein
VVNLEAGMKRNHLNLSIAALLLGLLAGCVTTTTTVPGASSELLKFFNIGHTTREEVLLKLGKPSAAFEMEKILTYRIGEDPARGFYLVSGNSANQPWKSVCYSLVLVFDVTGVLQRQNLVRVR